MGPLGLSGYVLDSFRAYFQILYRLSSIVFKLTEPTILFAIDPSFCMNINVGTIVAPYLRDMLSPALVLIS